MNFAAFADELVRIKTSALSHVLAGAAAGAGAAGASGQQEYIPHAMMLGGTLGAGIRRSGPYHWKTPVFVGLGGMGTYLAGKAVLNRVHRDKAVADEYNRQIQATPPIDYEQWS